jgi:hypothetical protein
MHAGLQQYMQDKGERDRVLIMYERVLMKLRKQKSYKDLASVLELRRRGVGWETELLRMDMIPDF